jgi:hypothetical protein
MIYEFGDVYHMDTITPLGIVHHNDFTGCGIIDKFCNYVHSTYII